MSSKHGIVAENMDLTADPGKDFFRYANGGWIDRTEIPPEFPRWGSFVIVTMQAYDQVKDILQNATASQGDINSNEGKIGAFYHAGMNEAKVEKDGVRPIAHGLKRIAAIRNLGQLTDVIAYMHLCGPNVFFGFGGTTDYMDSTRVIAFSQQSGLGLPDRDYYLKSDPRFVEIREKYLLHIERMFVLLGDKPKSAKRAAKNILAIETKLAFASTDNETLRDPHANYNKMSVDAWQQTVPSLPLKRYLAGVNCKRVKSLNVAQPDFFRGLNEVLSGAPLSHLKQYLRWHWVSDFAGTLSKAFADASFDFYGRTLSGTQEQQPRWRRIVSATNGSLGEIVGEVYVQKHFPPEAKKRMLTLVKNLTEALREVLTNVTWMSDETRQRALAKLDTFVAKIGYPDKWKNYTALKISRNSYAGNVLRAQRFASQRNLAKIDKPVDRSLWGMTPQTVNAYYRATANEIVFPAGILQAPFFDLNADDASNYGGIGVIIGHEMTHGYDDKGSKFDADGNLQNWWTDADRAAFMANIERIMSQYAGFQIPTGEYLKPKLVSGEAAADLGGVKLAYLALQKALQGQSREKDTNGFTPEQRFFISFGQVWKNLAREKYLQLSLDNPHPPANFRVNGTLANLPEFAQAFNLPTDSPIMLAPEKRCLLW